MYVTIRGRVELFEDASYPRKVTRDGKKVEEVVSRFQMALTIPESTEPIKVDLAGDAIPPQPTMDDWELNMKWVVVECDGWRHTKGTTDDRAWSMVSFHAMEPPREMTQQEQKDLLQRRKTSKTQKKEESKKRRAAKQAKADEKTAA